MKFNIEIDETTLSSLSHTNIADVANNQLREILYAVDAGWSEWLNTSGVSEWITEIIKFKSNDYPLITKAGKPALARTQYRYLTQTTGGPNSLKKLVEIADEVEKELELVERLQEI